MTDLDEFGDDLDGLNLVGAIDDPLTDRGTLERLAITVKKDRRSRSSRVKKPATLRGGWSRRFQNQISLPLARKMNGSMP
jgi:hypothetical protein